MPDAGHVAVWAFAATAGRPPAPPPAGAACRAARLSLGWSLDRLAAAAGVSAGTVERLERGVPGRPAKDRAVRAALAAAARAGTPDAQALRALARRLRRGRGPDPALDAELARAVDRLRRAAAPERYAARPGPGPAADGGGSGREPPPYTARLDTALTLYRVRPARLPSDPREACAEALRRWLG